MNFKVSWRVRVALRKKEKKSLDTKPLVVRFGGAFGALKVLSTVNPATLCSSNRMEIIPQSDFNILTKICPEMQNIWMYMIAHFGAKCTFLRKNALLAPEKKGEKLTHGEPNWVFLGQNPRCLR